MISFKSLDKFPAIGQFCTTRQGGVSKGKYESFNISPFSGDSPNNQQENIQILTKKTGIKPGNIIFPFQTHGDEVRIIDKEFLLLENEEKTQYLTGVDALITNLHNICIGITTADCVPLLYFDPQKNIVAVAHAGWRGTQARIAKKTIKLMSKYLGSEPSDIHVVLGPSISPRAYVVGNDVFSEFQKTGFPVEKIFTKKDSQLFLDLWTANKWLLMQSGVPENQIEISGICTFENHEQFFSARKLGIKSGRMLSGIYLKSSS